MMSGHTREDLIDTVWAAMDDRNDLDVSMRDLAEAAIDAIGASEMLTALKWAEAALAPFSKEPAEKSGISLLRAAIAKADPPEDAKP